MYRQLNPVQEWNMLPFLFFLLDPFESLHELSRRRDKLSLKMKGRVGYVAMANKYSPVIVLHLLSKKFQASMFRAIKKYIRIGHVLRTG